MLFIIGCHLKEISLLLAEPVVTLAAFSLRVNSMNGKHRQVQDMHNVFILFPIVMIEELNYILFYAEDNLLTSS